VLIVVALSGAALVWRDELEKLAGPDVVWDEQRLAPFEHVRDRAIALRPAHRLQMIWFPGPVQPYFTAAYAVGDVEYTAPIYLHPETAEVLEDSPSSVFAWIEELHENLHLGSLGSWLVAWSTPALGLLLVTGTLLACPVSGPVSRIWRVRRGRPLLLDTHRVSGLVALPALSIMAFTGAVWVFPDGLEPLVHLAAGERTTAGSCSAFWRLESVAPSEQSVDGDVSRMLRWALNDAGEGARVDYVSFPIRPRENRQIRLDLGGPLGGVQSVYYFDRYTGDLLARSVPGEGGAERYLALWNYALHVGTIGGATTRVVWFLACLVLVHLTWSGVYIWARRRISG
jgi:uncharacterized iron-regulated membrane protein